MKLGTGGGSSICVSTVGRDSLLAVTVIDILFSAAY